LYPDYGGNPKSIPYWVDISPCRQASLYVRSNPSELVLDRQLDTIREFGIEPEYKNYFTNSEWSYCPLIAYELLDTSNQAYTDSKITLAS